eukprot:6179657-Pleurochrysis_carterae.AAC.4
MPRRSAGRNPARAQAMMREQAEGQAVSAMLPRFNCAACDKPTNRLHLLIKLSSAHRSWLQKGELRKMQDRLRIDA